MAEGGAAPSRSGCSPVGYARLGEETAAAGAWSDEWGSSTGLEELLDGQPCPSTGYGRFDPAVPPVRLGQQYAERSQQSDYDPLSVRTKLDLQVQEPQLEEVSCCNVCLGTRWKPFPVTFQIVTMSDSPLLCANYMVVRRWDEDFIRLYNSLRSQFAFNVQLMTGLTHHRPQRLAQITDDALTLQCGRHKKLLKWILSVNAFYSSHDLHAFIGCKAAGCPSRLTGAVRKFPQYPPGAQRSTQQRRQ